MPRILIVDDEPAIRNLLALAFRKAGYAVEIAGAPSEAMRICAAQPFDAVLSDVRLPEMTGHDLARWLAECFPATRCVLMTGLDADCQTCPFRPRCRRLTKPFRMKEAVDLVDSVLSEPANNCFPG